MNPEQRFVGHWIQILIEFLIIFICHISRLTNPCRLDIVDDIVFVGIDIFAVFPFLLLSECDGNWQVTAVLGQQAVDLVFVQEIFVLVVNIQDDVCSAIFFFRLFQCVFGCAVAAPFHRNGSFFIRFGDDLHFLGNHERRIETKSEVADDGGCVVLVFFNELFCAGEGDLIDIFVDLFGSHTDTAVGDFDRIAIEADMYSQISQFSFELADRSQCFQLLCCINCVRYQFTKKNFVITIQKLFDDREDVLTRNTDVSLFCHNPI